MKQVKKQKRLLRESLSYTVEVRDKEGRVLQHISAPSRSYVQQWNQLLNVQAAQANKTVKDTGGIDRTAVPDNYNLRMNAGIGGTSYGLRVGKGTTAVVITDYALESPCEEGTGLDEFNHQVMYGLFTEPSVVGSTCSFTFRRTLINNSGATISGIKEIGGYGMLMPGNFAMVFRDVLGTACDVPDGGAITVEYTIGVTA